MSREQVLPTIVEDVASHPAAAAWELVPGRPCPAIGVTPLKAQRRSKHKSGVYRLHFAGGNGAEATVIAKRCLRRTAGVERRIYEQLLPRLGVPTLRMHGFLGEDDEGFCWMFIEDAGQTEVTVAERTLAARWLGRVHSAAASLIGGTDLPRRGAEYYHVHLEGARQLLLAHVDSAVLSAADRRVLNHLLALCQLMDSRWAEIDRLFEQVPVTLVHGDFALKNMRVRHGVDSATPADGGGSQFFVLDWETAGIGVPAPDLSTLITQFGGDRSAALNAYLETGGALWANVSREQFERVAHVGAVFRIVASIDWACHGLPYTECIERPMRQLRTYEPRLCAALAALGWET